MKAFFTEFGEVFFNNSKFWNKPFNINEESPFNLDNYPGRMGYFYATLDVRTLFKSKSEINGAVQTLETYKSNLQSNKANKIDNPTLWDAKRIVSSAIHPDTKEIIPWPFRFAAFPAINIPICVLLLFPGSNSMQVFSQFVNQSYNVSVNYYNRNASNPMSNTTLGISYVSAVSMSCGIALGLRKFAQKYIKNKNGVLFRSLIPYTALTLASSFNVYFIRWNEIMDGITLKYKKTVKKRITLEKEENGIKTSGSDIEIIGNPNDYIEDIEWIETPIKSKRAGHVALAKCCIARFVWSIPPLFFPPILMRLFNRGVWWKAAPLWQRLGIEAGVIGCVLFTSMPPSLAVFPQQDKISLKWLEPEFKQFVKQEIGDDNENACLYFNKGL